MMRFLLPTALAVALMTGSTVAEGYIALGLGLSSSCGTWVEVRGRRLAIGQEQWVFGFLTGVGSAGVYLPSKVNPLQGVDANAVLAWMDNYCQAHPLENVGSAAGAFVVAHPR
jgi:hypothetical protein